MSNVNKEKESLKVKNSPKDKCLVLHPTKPYFEYLYGMKSEESDDTFDYCTAFMFA